MALLKNGTAETARREQAVSPVIQRAATDLVALDDRGIPTNIKIQGKPYDVLTDLVDEMDRIGASQHSMRQVLTALEEFCVHEGVNFSREASAAAPKDSGSSISPSPMKAQTLRPAVLERPRCSR